MKVTGIFRYISLLPIAGVAALCFYPVAARAAVTPTGLVESKLGGETILSSPAKKLISTVQDCVKENPHRSAGIVTAVLKGGRADADAIAPQVTAAAIIGLGAGPSPLTVGDIVYSSVKATPAVVLETVKAAVKAAPSCATAIVKAAVRAVPNPNDKIQPVGEMSSSTNGYDKDDSKDFSKESPPQGSVPIGEAIAQAAAQADPSLSYQDLLNAVNQAESEHTGFNVTDTYSGYYYPPIVSGGTSGIPTSVPTPPVVSK